jgi:hypothetical protein
METHAYECWCGQRYLYDFGGRGIHGTQSQALSLLLTHQEERGH